LNDLVIDTYEHMDTAVVRSYFPQDHTHTNKAGALINAQLVVKGLQQLKDCSLNEYIKK
jgi:rhamnogalacturonan acetylesterase